MIVESHKSNEIEFACKKDITSHIAKKMNTVQCAQSNRQKWLVNSP